MSEPNLIKLTVDNDDNQEHLFYFQPIAKSDTVYHFNNDDFEGFTDLSVMDTHLLTPYRVYRSMVACNLEYPDKDELIFPHKETLDGLAIDFDEFLRRWRFLDNKFRNPIVKTVYEQCLTE